MSDWMIVLSGPLGQRGPLLAALHAAGVDVEQAHGPHGLPAHADGPAEDPTVGWITARTGDLDDATAHAARAGWVLRAHWPTPRCGVCSGIGKANGPTGHGDCLHCAGTGRTPKPAPSPEQQLADTIRGLQQRISELEARS